MVDHLSPQKRSWNMSRIRGANTSPEICLRSLLHRAGFRFRLHDKKLPGKPDIVLRKYRTVIFVNGCFWHRHPGCTNATTPKTRHDFWEKKFNDTVERDERNRRQLKNADWNIVTVWECELKKSAEETARKVADKIRRGADV